MTVKIASERLEVSEKIANLSAELTEACWLGHGHGANWLSRQSTVATVGWLGHGQ